ncbi:MAG: hypothetical protein IPH33_19760 [Bacteroidetes bacterium]|nr:hypothetical protein [Bacteroidota bacterium]
MAKNVWWLGEYANSVIQTNDGGYMIVGDNCDLPDWHGSMDYWAANLIMLAI